MLLDPATGNNFFGRDDILSLLKKRLEGLRCGYRQNIAIIGQIYYGKTSIIYRFINDMSFKDVVPIYIEVRQQGFLNFAEKFTSTLLFQYLKVAEYKLDHTTELLPMAHERLPKTARAVKEIKALLKNGDEIAAYSVLFELPAIAYAETNLRPIIIMDEFHRIDDFGIKEAFSILGKNIMFQKDTMYIVTSSCIDQAKKTLSEKLSLLFGNFEICELDTFDVATAMGFVDFKLGQNRLSQGLKSFLVAFTDGHPFYLDCLLLKLNEYLNSRTHSDLYNNEEEIMIKTFVELFFDSKGILNQYFASSVLELERMDRRYIHALLSIANGNRKVQTIAEAVHLRPDELRPLLQKLAAVGLVLKYGVFYVISDKVLEFWLKNVHQNKESRLDTDYELRISKFRIEIKKYLEAFLSASKQNYVQKLTELFCNFNGELLCMDKRCLIFPAFRKASVHNAESDGISYLLLSNDKCKWAFLISTEALSDSHITNFLNYFQRHKEEIKRKIIISPYEMDTNTKLLAKKAKVWIWTPKELNGLLDIAGKQRMVLPNLNKSKSESVNISNVHHLETA